jgi:hypothetical protein
MHYKHPRYLYFLVLLLLVSFTLSNNILASDSTHTHLNQKKSVWQNFVGDIGVFFTDWGSFLTYPLRMSGKDWLIGAGAIGGTALISLADKQVTKKISRGGNDDYHHDFWDAPTAYGYVLYPAAFAGGLYLTGLFSGSDKLRVTARMLGESLAYSGTIAYGLKFVFGRERPTITDNQYQFKGFQTNQDYQSLPSGHIVVAFSVSTVLAERINSWWSRVLFYGAASLTAYSRILNNKHWLSDAVFTGLLGFGTGWFVVHRENEREKNITNKEKGGSGISINPALNGFSVCYSF